MRNLAATLRLLLTIAAGLLFSSAALAGTWQGWTEIPNGKFLNGSSVVAVGPKKDIIVVFGRGLNSQLYWNVQTNGQWRGWSSLGGSLASSPSCVSWGGTRIDCFAQGPLGHLVHIATDNTLNWSNWEDLGGVIVGAPSATSFTTQYLSVFAQGTDHTLFKIGFDFTFWNNWKSLGGILTTSPGCGGASVPSDAGPWAADCFVNGVDNKLHQWWAYQDGPSAGGPPPACHWYYFKLCTNGTCETCQPDLDPSSPGQGWIDADGLTLDQPSVVFVVPKHVELFVRGLDNRLWQRSWHDLGGWRQWDRLDGNLNSGPSCTSGKGGLFVCTAVFGDGSAYLKTQTP